MRGTRDQVCLRTWLGGLVSSEMFTESLDASNVTGLVIWGCSLDIEIESINVDSLGQVEIGGASIQRTNTSICDPSGIVWSICAPQEIG